MRRRSSASATGTCVVGSATRSLAMTGCSNRRRGTPSPKRGPLAQVEQVLGPCRRKATVGEIVTRPAIAAGRRSVPLCSSGTLRRVAALPAQVVVCAFRHQGTVRRLLTALVQCGLAHRAICPADGILRSGPVKMECTHENIACKDCGATISP